jgi:hypothetical protein
VNAQALLQESNHLLTPRLEHVLNVFRRWLYMPDETPLLTVLGTVAANLLDGDPVWTILIGAPGSSKSEILQSLLRLPDIHAAATITEASLLSGTPGKEYAKHAKGGLLREVGEFGLVVCKDLGSLLSMHGDDRARTFAALREIYDGSWTRRTGNEGGLALHWEGKVGLLAGCTQAIDKMHSLTNLVGERFVYVRMPHMDPELQARWALAHGGREKMMRAELATAIGSLFEGGLPRTPKPVGDDDTLRLIELSTFAVRCRSAVDRDSRTREIELIPEAEAPTRLAKVLYRMLCGLDAIGLDRDTAWPLLTKVALDSIPELRLATLRAFPLDGATSLPNLIEHLGYPKTTVHRVLQDLRGHRIIQRAKGTSRQADLWQLTDWTRDKIETLNRRVPEIWNPSQDRVPETWDAQLTLSKEQEQISETRTDTPDETAQTQTNPQPRQVPRTSWETDPIPQPAVFA